MPFNTIPEELILLIWDFIATNKDMLAMRACCTYLKHVGDKWGFLKTIAVDYATNIMKFMQMYHNYAPSPLALTFSHRVTPSRWIPHAWPKLVMFVDCYMDRDLIDPPVSPTTELHISDSRSDEGVIRINWRKFPRLKALFVQAHDVMFTGIESCTELERVDVRYRGWCFPREPAPPQNIRELQGLRQVVCNGRTVFSA